MPKIAVITPYWKPDLEKLERCISSVSGQTVHVTHYLIGDGVKESLLDTLNVKHIVLPSNVGSTGATPRGVGALLAFNDGADYICFLDADNWFDPDHIRLSLELLLDKNIDVALSRRIIVFPDGEVLAQEDPQDGTKKHIDSNCFFISKNVAFLAGIWAMYPTEFGSGEDRPIPFILKQFGIDAEYLDKPTVFYETNWATHYKLANKTPVAPLRRPQRNIQTLFSNELYQSYTGISLGINDAIKAVKLPKKNLAELRVAIICHLDKAEVLNLNTITCGSLDSLNIIVGNEFPELDVISNKFPCFDLNEKYTKTFALQMAGIFSFKLEFDIIFIQDSINPFSANECELIVQFVNRENLGFLVVNKHFVDGSVGKALVISRQNAYLSLFILQISKYDIQISNFLLKKFLQYKSINAAALNLFEKEHDEVNLVIDEISNLLQSDFERLPWTDVEKNEFFSSTGIKLEEIMSKQENYNQIKNTQPSRKKRVLILVDEYPQVSQTYIKNEIEGLINQNCLVEIVSRKAGNYPFRSRQPHIVLTKENQPHVIEYLKSFRPDVIHAHYMTMLPTAAAYAKIFNCPYTVRAHSFDTADRILSQLDVSTIVGDKNFRGILCFPYSVDRLKKIGFSDSNLVSCFPVIDVNRFFNKSDNGSDVLNVGAPIPKKNVEEYIRLSALVPDRRFDYLGTGYNISNLVNYNKEVGGRINFLRPIDPNAMPGLYKRYAYLVYTASVGINEVGWPMACIEAMASGVQVYVQGIRNDLKDFLGPAGILFESTEEIVSDLKRSPDKKKISKGYEWVEQFDYRKHIHLLTDLWD